MRFLSVQRSRACLDIPLRDRLLHLASSVTMKETQVPEAAYFTPGNTAPIHLLSDTKAESINWKIK